MKPKFSIKDNNLLFLKDGLENEFNLPYPAKELVGLKKFISDLNRRLEKITDAKVSANSHYVFIEREHDEIRVKFPSVKSKHILVDKDTHRRANIQAKKAGLPIKDYVRLCLIQCEGNKNDS